MQSNFSKLQYYAIKPYAADKATINLTIFPCLSLRIRFILKYLSSLILKSLLNAALFHWVTFHNLLQPILTKMTRNTFIVLQIHSQIYNPSILSLASCQTHASKSTLALFSIDAPENSMFIDFISSSQRGTWSSNWWQSLILLRVDNYIVSCFCLQVTLQRNKRKADFLCSDFITQNDLQNSRRQTLFIFPSSVSSTMLSSL